MGFSYVDSIMLCSLYTHFVERFLFFLIVNWYWILSSLFCIYWVEYMTFILKFVNMIYHIDWASLVTQWVKNLPVMQEIWVWFLGQEDPLEKEMAAHSSILAWRIPVDRRTWLATIHGVTRVGHILITLINMQILNHSCIPIINPTWSCCMILLLYFWIRFANILLRIFVFLYISSTGLWFSLLSYHCLVLISGWSWSQNELWSIPFSAIFRKVWEVKPKYLVEFTWKFFLSWTFVWQEFLSLLIIGLFIYFFLVQSWQIMFF